MGLDAVELVMAFEDEFQIVITDYAASKMMTPRDVIDHVASLRPDLDRDAIAARVREITIEQLGNIDYGEERRFVDDFGVD